MSSNKLTAIESNLFGQNQHTAGVIVAETSPHTPINSDTEKGKREQWLPLLPTTNTVLFPSNIIHLTIKDKDTIQLATSSYKKNGHIGVLASKKDKHRNDINDFYPIGTLAKILRVVSLSEDRAEIILQGKERFQINEIIKKKEQFLARVQYLQDEPLDLKKQQTKALIQSIKEIALKILQLLPDSPVEIRMMLENIHNPVFLVYYIAANRGEFLQKQKLLEAQNSTKRASLLLKYLLKDLQFAQLKHKIRDKAHSEIGQKQREFYLREHIKIIQDELGETDETDEIDVLYNKAKKKKWPENVKKHFYKNLDRAAKMHVHTADYTTLINYLHILIDLPWQTYTQDNHDLVRAQKILDKDHYAMEKVKDRILEFLAVHQLTKELKGPILCLDGPPGVGKTSLCKAIAQALGRKYVKMSLGGLHDEAELRGHRRTYVGAMLGKVMNLIKSAATANPVFVLDEIDKIDHQRGIPYAALLEILDPAQNPFFQDNFLEVSFDLSKVLFIATANDRYKIPPPLADRMEFIEVNSYSLEEKIQIARKHLFPKERKKHGLKATEISIQQEAIQKLIQNYTKEAGVRELQRQLGTLVRKTAKAFVLQQDYSPKITPSQVSKLLGVKKYDLEHYEKIGRPGIAVGLAWTSVGGEITFVESVLTKGEGKLTISGLPGEIIEESATAAYSYLKANAAQLHIEEGIFQNYDLHIHLPDGATPIDGPSAGITLYTSLASLYTQRLVKENLAMTGEITLRGAILPVGGIKEKVLAAKRAGIKQVILSEKNKKDIQEINPSYLKDLTFHYPTHIDQLLPLTLQPQKVKNAKTWLSKPNQKNKK